MGSRRRSSVIERSTEPIELLSKWDRGIAVIDSLLQAGSDTYLAMSEHQRSELICVKNLLVDGIQDEDHIPYDLLQLQRDADGSISSDHDSSSYLLKEFGGVVPKRKMKSVFLANAFVSGALSLIRPQGNNNSNSARRSGSSGNNKLLDALSAGGGAKASTTPTNNSPTSLSKRPSGTTTTNSTTKVTYYVPNEWTDLSLENKQKLATRLSWSSLAKWNFDIFELDELSNSNPLLFMAWAILGSPNSQRAMQASIISESGGKEEESNNKKTTLPTSGYDFISLYKIPEHTLCNYFRQIEKDYNKTNPYHNNVHGADVLQSLHSLLEINTMDGGPFVQCDKLELFSLLVAAAVHDVGHPGYNNSYQVNAQTDLAIQYNDISVLENMHASFAFRTMKQVTSPIKGQEGSKPTVITNKTNNNGGGEEKTNDEDNYNDEKPKEDMWMLKNMTRRQIETVRQLVIDAILHTDMSKHFQLVNSMKGVLRTKQSASNGDTATKMTTKPAPKKTNDDVREHDNWKILAFMLHMADISNPTKPSIDIVTNWTDRCLSEFFLQGDKERSLGLNVSPLCDRATTSTPNSQIGFINFVVKPSFEVLAEFMPPINDIIVASCITPNLKYWQTQLIKFEMAKVAEEVDDDDDDDDDN